MKIIILKASPKINSVMFYFLLAYFSGYKKYVCGCKRCANNIPPITYVTYVASVPYISNYAQFSPQGLKNPVRCSILVDVRTSSQGRQKASKT